MRKSWVLAALAAGLGIGSAASAASFISDPAAHAGTITLNANGTISVVSGGVGVAGTYDGTEDVVYNVINNSSSLLTGFSITGTGISEFDADGINNYVNSSGTGNGNFGTVVNTVSGPSTYYGYTNNALNFYSSFTTDLNGLGNDTVNVVFGGGGVTANGGTGFFSLEFPGAMAGGAITIGVQSVPLPNSLLGGLGLLAMCGVYSKFSKFRTAV